MEPIAVLEIGTSHVRALLAEVVEDGGITVTGLGEVCSEGIRKGEISEREMAVLNVAEALKKAEEEARGKIERVWLVTSGGEADCRLGDGRVNLADPEENIRSEIGDSDVDEVIAQACAVMLDEKWSRMHELSLLYSVDDVVGVQNPVGMMAEHLSLSMLVVYGKRSTIDNYRKLVEDVPIECADAIFSGYAAALAVTTEDQRKAGVLVIDLGAGTTDYVLFRDGVPWVAGAFQVAGDHITSDVMTGLNISWEQAERVKKSDGCAITNRMERETRISIPALSKVRGKMVRASALNTIINARMEEIFMLVKRRVERKLGQEDVVLASGVVLTGGGAYLNGVDDLGTKVFNQPCLRGEIKGVKGLHSLSEAPRYATLLGAVRYADSIREKLVKLPWWKRFWRMLIGEDYA